MKKSTAFLMLLVLLAGASGCESLPKKFIRKKKEPEHRAATVYLDEGPYQKQYSNEYYYKTHYTLFRTWQSDLLTQLGGNHRKVERAAQEALGHLNDMNRYLKPEKQKQMAEILDGFGKVANRISAGNYAKSEEFTMRSDIERYGRLVANDFYFDKVKDDIIPENIDLGNNGSTASTGSAAAPASP